MNRLSQRDQTISLNHLTDARDSAEEAFPVLVGVFGVLLVGVSVVASALALRDARNSMTVLASVGASRSTLRRMNAISAVATTTVGLVSGLLIGVVPLLVVISGTKGYAVLGVPWAWLAGQAGRGAGGPGRLGPAARRPDGASVGGCPVCRW